MAARNAPGGFTLVELAVVLAIVALLLGALLAPLATQQSLRKNKEAERDLREIKEALLGFAVANGRLPWPDRNFTPDGLENIPGTVPSPPSSCTACEGRLPWRDLGLRATDVWGRLYIYRISSEFGYAVQTGQPAQPGQMDLTDAGTVRVNTRDEAKGDIVLTQDAAAVVVSLGSNGQGGGQLDGNVIPQAAAGTDERTNSDSSNPAAPTAHFYSRRITLPTSSGCSDTVAGSPYCEFDDLVMWIPRVVLINRMVEAGRLP